MILSASRTDSMYVRACVMYDNARYICCVSLTALTLQRQTEVCVYVTLFVTKPDIVG